MNISMFMMKRSSRPVFVLFSCLAVVWFVETHQAEGQDKVNPNARVQADFQDRIAKYMELRDSVKKKGPKIKETADPAQIRAAQDALAQNIKAARSTAKPGDIFTPEVRATFRRLMYPEMKGPDAAETKETLKEDAPNPATVLLKVNARYPEAQPLPTVPANLLTALPKLPEGLEYRIVKKDLILRDVDANLIVDFIPNAIR